jgi:hypothetical protein
MLIVCLAGRMSTVYGKLQNAEIDGFEFTVTITISVSVLSIPPLCDAVLCFLDRDVHIKVQRDRLVEGSMRVHSQHCVRLNIIHTSSVRRGFRG